MPDTIATRGLTPSQLAARYGIGIHKVLTWINRGELAAINVATIAAGRPQWVILPEAMVDFESRRTARPQEPAPRHKRRTQMELVEKFF